MPGDAGQACASACRHTRRWADPVIGQRVPTGNVDTVQARRDKLSKTTSRVGALVVAIPPLATKALQNAIRSAPKGAPAKLAGPLKDLRRSAGVILIFCRELG